MIMMMKSSKVKKIVVGVDNDSVYAEQATTSSDILNLDSLSVAGTCDQKYHKIQYQSTSFLKDFLGGMPPRTP